MASPFFPVLSYPIHSNKTLTISTSFLCVFVRLQALHARAVSPQRVPSSQKVVLELGLLLTLIEEVILVPLTKEQVQRL